MNTCFITNQRMYQTLLIIVAMSSFLLTGCACNEKPTIAIEPSTIQEISVTLYSGETASTTDSEAIEVISDVFNDVSITKEDSVQDVPHVKSYGKITILSEDNVCVMYYYEKNGDCYIEEPYIGIYQCKKNLDAFFSSLLEQSFLAD